MDANADQDHYATLNVSRKAGSDEIRAAYMRLASLLHPDKYSVSETKKSEEAEREFLAVDRAYKVLTDPMLRHAYDNFGNKGVKLLQVLPQNEIMPLRYPVEVSYLLKELTIEEAMVRSLTSPTTWPTAGVLTFDLEVPRPISVPRLKQLTVDNQFEIPLPLPSSNVSMFAGIYMTNRKNVGMGMGYVGGRLKLSQHSLLTANLIMGPQRKLAVEASRDLSRKTSLRAELSANDSGVLTFKVASSHQLGTGVVGEADLEVGDENHEALGYGVRVTHGNKQYTGRMRFSSSELVTFKATVVRRLSQIVGSRIVAKLGTKGPELLLELTRELSHVTGIDLGMALRPAGVFMMLRARRGRMSVYMPIKIGPGFDPVSICAGLVAQTLVNTALLCVVHPVEKLRVQKELRALEKKLTEDLSKGRKRAAAQVRLMAPAAQRKREEEEAKDGLVMLQARYGPGLQYAPDPTWFAEGREGDASLDVASDLDVTVPLQFFVQKSGLHLPAGSKAHLLGFYDVSKGPWILYRAFDVKAGADVPDAASAAAAQIHWFWGHPEGLVPSQYVSDLKPEHMPKLYVRYRLKGRVFEVTVDDLRPLDVPGETDAVLVGPADRVVT